MKNLNREAWLEQAAKQVEGAILTPLGHSLPKHRVSCSWPSSRPTKVIGQCWFPEASEGKITEIFISPKIADSNRVLDILLHELIHAVCGPDVGHKGLFKQLARECGLEGKLTSTNASDELLERFTPIVDELGHYPHASLDIAVSPVKKQTTRMIKAECPDCGYTGRFARKWIDLALPVCPIHKEEMEIT